MVTVCSRLDKIIEESALAQKTYEIMQNKVGPAELVRVAKLPNIASMTGWFLSERYVCTGFEKNAEEAYYQVLAKTISDDRYLFHGKGDIFYIIAKAKI
jgi:hypothetical protein